MEKQIWVEKIFTGSEWLYNHEIVFEDGVIRSVHPFTERTLVRANAETFLAPAFVDFQVYGAAGKLFAQYPEPGTLRLMNEVFSSEGTCLFQPTLATNTLEVFKKGIDAVRAYWSNGGKGVYGLHLEGPWIAPERRGAHVKAFVHPPTLEEAKELLQYGEGVIKTITLAPEVCPPQVLDWLLTQEVVISAGHSNATCSQAVDSFDRGITTITHLYNAMSPLHHRQPGLVGAAFYHKEVLASIIPDGHHVDFMAVAVAKKLMGERLFAITDAVTQTDEGPYQHQFAGDKYECNGILSGAAISMHGCCYNLVHKVHLPAEEALRMCSLYPARALGAAYQYGKIAPGFAARFIRLNTEMEKMEVING